MAYSIPNSIQAISVEPEKTPTESCYLLNALAKHFANVILTNPQNKPWSRALLYSWYRLRNRVSEI